MNGKDSAQARYISTMLSDITKYIFIPDDEHVVEYIIDEGQAVEPHYYVPILPMVLVNGVEGIGTGWSTFIPNYNPKDIVRNIQRKIQGLPFERMKPFYKGFTGQIERLDNNNYTC